MSDYPERAVESIRRQCEMVLEFDGDLVDELRKVETAQEIHAVDALDESDSKILAAANGQEDLGRLLTEYEGTVPRLPVRVAISLSA